MEIIRVEIYDERKGEEWRRGGRYAEGARRRGGNAQDRTGWMVDGYGYGCCEIIAYSVNIKAWQGARFMVLVLLRSVVGCWIDGREGIVVCACACNAYVLDEEGEEGEETEYTGEYIHRYGRQSEN